jgi:hypothetical protein
VATQAPDETLRLEALERLSDRHDLVAVALRSDHKEVALGALERLDDPESLESIAARARSKAVARRARARLTALEEEASAREAERRRLADLCRQAEMLASQSDPAQAFERMLVLQQTWRKHESVDADLVTRFDRACTAVQAKRDEYEIEQAERLCRLRARQQAMARRAALCEAIERLNPQTLTLDAAQQDHGGSAPGEAAVAEAPGAAQASRPVPEDMPRPSAGVLPLREFVADLLERHREDWDAAGDVDGDEGRALEARFAAACAALTRRCEAWEEARVKQAELVAVCVAVEQLAEAEIANASGVPAAPSPGAGAAEGHAPPESASIPAPAPPADPADPRARRAALRRAWSVLMNEAAAVAREAGFPAELEALVVRFEAADARVRAKEAEGREARARQQREEVVRVERQLDVLDALAATSNLSLKEAERALRHARQILDVVRTASAGRKAFEPLVDRAKAVHTALYPRVQELRELNEWKRWANLGVQEDLCGRLEALLEARDLPWVAKQLRLIEAEWKEASDIPADRAEPIRRRFKAAHGRVRARCEAFFVKQAEQRAENLRQKVAICERAEALAESTDWIPTADAFKQLQKEWQQIGGVPQQEAQAVWQRFRAACDRFFQRRHDDLARRKERWAANLAAKQGLCEQAEVLAESSDWAHALTEIKRLQAQWRTIGPVRKNKSEAIWQRFRAACDRFFERYAHRDQLQLQARLAAHEALCQELEQLVSALAASETVAPEDLAERVRDVRRRRLAAGELPRAPHEALRERLERAIAALVERAPERFRGTDLDPDATRRRMEKLCARVEGLLVEVSQPARAESPAEALARQLRERLASNTIAGGAATPPHPKRPAAPEIVREAQSAWRRLGPLPGEEGRALATRFNDVCRRVLEAYRQPSSHHSNPLRGRSHAHASQTDST